MQEVQMSISPAQRRTNQLPLFARPQRNPLWMDLSTDVQQKIVKLLMPITEAVERHRREGQDWQGRLTVSEKIKPHHVEPKAILYVCQSSASQVWIHLESQKLQY